MNKKFKKIFLIFFITSILIIFIYLLNLLNLFETIYKKNFQKNEYLYSNKTDILFLNNFFIVKSDNYIYIFSNYQNPIHKVEILNINELYNIFLTYKENLKNFYNDNFTTNNNENKIINNKTKNNSKTNNKNKIQDTIIKINDYRDYLLCRTNIKIHFIPENISNFNEIFFILKRAILERKINIIVIKKELDLIELLKNKKFNILIKINNLFNFFNLILTENSYPLFYNNSFLLKNFLLKKIVLYLILILNFLYCLFILVIFFNIVYNFLYNIFYINFLFYFITLLIFLKINLNLIYNLFLIFVSNFENSIFSFFFYKYILFNPFNQIYLIYFLYFSILIFLLIYKNSFINVNFIIFYSLNFLIFFLFYLLDKNLLNLNVIFYIKKNIEKIFFIRPRIKEIISFPFLILYFHNFNPLKKLKENKIKKKFFSLKLNKNENILLKFILYIFSSLYFLSIINSFSHINSSFFISFLRTILGILFSIIIFSLIIIFYNFFKKYSISKKDRFNKIKVNLIKNKFIKKLFLINKKNENLKNIINIKKIKNTKAKYIKENKNYKIKIFVIISPTKNYGDNFYRFFYSKNFSKRKYKIYILNNNFKKLNFKDYTNLIFSNEVHFVGGIWQDKTSLKSFLFYFFILLISKLLFKKMKFISISIEKPKFKITRFLLLNFPYIDFIWARDYFSYVIFKKCSKKIFLFNDLFDLYLKNKFSKIYKFNSKNIEIKFKNNFEKNIAIIYNRNYIKIIRKIILNKNNLKNIKNNNYNLIFIIVEEKDIYSFFLLKKILKKFKIKTKYFYIFDKTKIENFLEINKRLIKCFQKINFDNNIIISFRFHVSLLLNFLIEENSKIKGENFFYLDEKFINYLINV